MPLYQYKAREPQGVIRDGELEAGDEADALRLLEAQQLLPIRLVRQREASLKSGERAVSALSFTRTAAAPRWRSFFRKRIKMRDLITYTRQLETLLDSGISLTQSLSILADQTSSLPLEQATRRVQDS